MLVRAKRLPKNEEAVKTQTINNVCRKSISLTLLQNIM